MARVLLKGVGKIYPGDVIAVRDLNLEISDGEFVCLLGPSGCGKSSTLRMIAGLERITGGDIYIGDTRVNDLEPQQRDISMVFENYALFPHLSAYDNIAFPLRVRGIPREQCDSRVREVAQLLDVTGFLHQRAESLGGGQRQRVGVARALVRRASVLLMDEPISHLDAELKARLRGEIARLQRLTKTTTVYVTHDQMEALAMADRIAVMNFGELQQFGTPEDVYMRPKNTFVAGFVGEPPINLLPAEITAESGGLFAVGDGLRFAIDSKQPCIQRGLKVVVGLRPSDFALISPEEEDGFSVTVRHFEPGVERSLCWARAGHRTDLLFVFPLEQRVSAGDTVRVKPNMIHIFDANTGLSLGTTSGKEG